MKDDKNKMIKKLLINWANSRLPGRSSAFRKYCRRNNEIPHTIVTRHGFTMALKPRDSVENQLIVYREFEPNLSALIKSLAHEARFFIDVGCKVGYFSCLFAKYAPSGNRVLSIDANPAMVDRCRTNLGLNKFNGEVLNYAIAEAVGEMTLSWPENAPSHASLGEPKGKNLKKIKVPTIPFPHLLDRLSWTHESILKVDIEGFEIALFRTLTPEKASQFKHIFFEYSEETYTNCGFTPRELWSLPLWDNYEIYGIFSANANRDLLPISIPKNSTIPIGVEIIWAKRRSTSS